MRNAPVNTTELTLSEITMLATMKVDVWYYYCLPEGDYKARTKQIFPLQAINNAQRGYNYAISNEDYQKHIVANRERLEAAKVLRKRNARIGQVVASLMLLAVVVSLALMF